MANAPHMWGRKRSLPISYEKGDVMKNEKPASQKPPADLRVSGVKRDRSAASLRNRSRVHRDDWVRPGSSAARFCTSSH